jgi:hypothetical protein
MLIILEEKEDEAKRLRDRGAEGDQDGEDKWAPLTMKRVTAQDRPCRGNYERTEDPEKGIYRRALIS